MPVVGHDAVREQPHVEALDGLGQDALEGFVVGRLGEDPRAGVGAVEGMLDDPAGRIARASRHGRSVTGRSLSIHQPDPLSDPQINEADMSATQALDVRTPKLVLIKVVEE